MNWLGGKPRARNGKEHEHYVGMDKGIGACIKTTFWDISGLKTKIHQLLFVCT